MFITFEGIEGCGKTTQIQLLKDVLVNEQGLDVVLTREPGGTPIANKIRAILVDAANTALVPACELLLYYAARAQHLNELILPSLQQGKTVLCDRFNDSSLAYQGFGRGLDKTILDTLGSFVLNGFLPDLTIVLDMPVTEGLNRARNRASTLAENQREDRFENEVIAFHELVRKGFLAMANENPGRFIVVNANRDIETVHLEIKRIVGQVLKSNTC